MTRFLRISALLSTALLIATPVSAQFGGGEGEVVLFAVTHHGPAGLQTAPLGGQNSPAQLSGFQVFDLSNRPFEVVVPGFAARTTQVGRNDPDDRFELITQFEKIPVPRTEILTDSKVFTMSGLIDNENTGGKGRIYLIGGALVPFSKNISIARELSLSQFKALFWRPDALTPPFRQVEEGFVGAADPPGQTGLEYQQNRSTVAVLTAWAQARKLYPGSSWPAGIDLKLLEEDPRTPSTIRLIRLKAGRKTPPFRFASRTHLFVLQGNVSISPAGGATTRMEPDWYAYLPAGVLIRLENPAEYDGPTATEESGK